MDTQIRRLPRIISQQRSILTWLGIVSVVGLLINIPCQLSAAETAAGDVKKVEQLSEKAMAKYQAKDYAGAIALYLEAYQVQPAGALLFNIATIYDKKLNQRDPAIEFYRRYISASDSDPELVRKTVERLKVLEDAKIAAAAAPVEGQGGSGGVVGTARAQGPFFTKERTRNMGIVTTVIGVGATGLGLYFGYQAKTKNDDAKKLCEGKICYDTRGVKLSKDAKDKAMLSTIVTSVGLAATAGGIVMILLPSLSPKLFVNDSVSVTPVVTDKGASVLLNASF
ncbi:MAG: hypothetical protein JW841_02460 [Deltaproteobacteria bacterium]|nr:hypothetical protein [Deltaproteobacteria bacterium]